jgi:hypothetical protein
MSIIAHFKEFYLGDALDWHVKTVSPSENVEQIVDLEKTAHKFSFRPEEQSVIEKLNTLDDACTHQALTSWEPNTILQKRGFKILSSGYGTVWEHPELNGWLIKASDSARKSTYVDGEGGRCNSLKYNNLHRIIMADRMRQEITDNHWDIHIPEKRLYRSSHASASESLHHKYYERGRVCDLRF